MAFMPKPRLLIIGPPPDSGTDELEAAFDVCQTENCTEVSPGGATGIDAIALLASRTVDQRFMAAFPALKIIASFGVGYDHVDARWAADHGITVTNTPGVLDEEVADTALGLLLCTVRELPQAMAYLKAGHWRRAPYRLTPATLRDRTVGLVGMGRIGQSIARRLDAFSVPVVYHARHPSSTASYRYHADLVGMAAAVDTLIVIVPGGAATHHLISREVFDALGPNGILINVARGSVVDQSALIAALASKRILAAGLDVYENEPEVPRALMELDNVVLLPHVGSASRYTRDRMQKLVVDNLLAWAAGEDLLTPVAESRARHGPALEVRR